MWYVINIIQFIIMGLWTMAVICCFMWYLPRRLMYFVANNIARYVLIKLAGGRVIVTGKEHIQQTRHCMYLSNHTSWLDILVILYSSKKMVHFIAKKELGKLPFIGFIMRRMGMIFVDRGNTKNSAKSVKETLARIKGGTTIVAFPEGTRSPDGKIGVFKKGLFGIAMKAGIDIVPVGIVGSSAVWHRNNTTFRPGIIEVNYGKPIRTTDYTDENISDLIVRVKNEIMVLSKQAHS